MLPESYIKTALIKIFKETSICDLNVDLDLDLDLDIYLEISLHPCLG